MAAMQERYDSAFLGILQNEGQIAKFLDVFFSFLYRRTDFYIEMKSKTDKLGFPPGVAQKLAFNAFMKYAEMAKIDKDRREKELGEKEKASATGEGLKEAQGPPLPAAVQEVEVETTHTSAPPSDGGDGDKPSSESTTKSTPPSQKQAKQSKTKSETTQKPAAFKKEKNEENEEKDDGKERVYQADPEAYNGAVREKYTWSQSITDADVRIFVPKNIMKGKDVKVEIQKKRLIAYHKGPDGSWMELVNGQLTWEVNKEESMWSLVPGEHIHVSLEKIQERWWEAVLEDEEKINVRKIDPSRPITDLDDEAQAKIGEMMYNEQRKRMGLPQSHEEKMHDMLKKAWDAEGSPFKGQPFDPSKVNIAGNNTMNPNM